METFWRKTGVQLGKHWKAVLGAVVVLTAVLGIGLTRTEFATGQDSYLNPDSQIAIDNVLFQDTFGGETIILLFTGQDDARITDLFEGANLAELERLNRELAEVDGVFSVVTPLTSITWSDALVGGPAGQQALLGALQRDEAGADARNADVTMSLARRGAVGPQEEWVIGNPAWNELLIFANDGFELDGDNQPVAPAIDDLVVRESLRGTFPNLEGRTPNSTSVGGIVLDGNQSLDELQASTDDALAILETARFEGFELTITGSPLYLGEINDYLKGGMLTLGLAAVVIMAVVLALLFTVRWRLLPLLAVLIGVLWAFSILGLLGIDLSLVTISGLPILIGLGIDFAIQVHNRVEEEVVLDKEEHPIAETVANLAPPLIVATLSGVLAFLALRISKVPMIRDFGVLLAIGVVVLLAIGIVVPVAALGIREWTTRTEERGESLVERIVVKLGGLPTKLGLPLMILAALLFVGGVLVEGRTKIQSDPLEWIDPGSPNVAAIERLEEETGFASTLGILVTANNVHDQQIIDLIYEFTIAAEERPEVVATSSIVGTMEKVIDIPGATPLAPTTEDIRAAAVVMPPDIARVLVGNPNFLDGPQTSTQVNLRLAQASLEERAVLVEELAADLERRIDELEVPADSALLVNLPEGQDAVKATPAGLATVGIGLLENLSANRANLTYLALCMVGIFLVVRFRSLTRALLALVPVLLAVGVSSLIVGLLGFELSPLTTVGGPLVIATCSEFSVLILGRYLEERQNGLDPRAASETAASRTGRAFFTSAATTIGGFAVLIGSALPLLRDFGILVTLNVAIALLAALVVMPPLSVWVDSRGWLGTQEQGVTTRNVHLAAKAPGPQFVGAIAGLVALTAGAVAVYATADTSSGASEELAFAATPLPTTTTTTTVPPEPEPTEAPPADDPVEDPGDTGDAGDPGDSVPTDEPTPETTEAAGPAIDPSTFPSDPPADPLQLTLFNLLVGGGGYTGQGVEPPAANCAISTALDAYGPGLPTDLAAQTPAALDATRQAVTDCGLDPAIVDAALAEFLGA